VTSIYANAVFAYSLPDLNLLGHVDLPALKLAGRDPIGAVPNWVTSRPTASCSTSPTQAPGRCR